MINNLIRSLRFNFLYIKSNLVYYEKIITVFFDIFTFLDYNELFIDFFFAPLSEHSYINTILNIFCF